MKAYATLLALASCGALTLGSPLRAQSLVGNWLVQPQVDPLTDEATVMLSTPDMETNSWLIVACGESGRALAVSWVATFATGDSLDVAFRFDAEPATAAEKWSVTRQRFADTAGTVAQPPNSRMVPMLLLMTVSERFVVRAYEDPDDGGDEYTAIFDVSGFTEALARCEALGV